MLISGLLQVVAIFLWGMHGGPVCGMPMPQSDVAAVSESNSRVARSVYPPQLPDAEEFVYKTIGELQLKLWVYRPPDIQVRPRPAIVFFFGGGWKNGSPQQFESQCEYLRSRGMVAITCDYRVASRHDAKVADCVEDAASAIRWVRSHAQQLGVDPDRIAAAGGSAGGHLAACTGTLNTLDSATDNHSTSARPNAMVLLNPALMLAPLPATDIPEAWARKLVELHARLGAEPQSLSPVHHVQPGQPAALILHGDHDTTVPLETVTAFANAMKAADNRCELVVFRGAGHGFFNQRGSTNKVGNESIEFDHQTQWHLRAMLNIDQFLQSLGWLDADSILPVVDNDHVRVRGSLQNSRRVFQDQKQGHVAFLGGSITEMNGYRPLLQQWLQQQFPDAQLHFTNAGIASTCSTTGAFRLDRDVLQQGSVDLLFVEFAVNDDQDARHSDVDCMLGMEGIIRRVRQHNPSADIVMVHFVNPGMVELLQQGQEPLSSRQHERLARYYGISSVYLSKEVTDRIEQGRLTWEQFGGTHPGPAGNQLAAELVSQVLQAGWSAKTAINGSEKETAKGVSPTGREVHPMPRRMLQPGAYATGRLVPHSELRLTSGWQIGHPDWKNIPGSFRDRFVEDECVFADQPDAELSLTFQGNAVGVYALAGPDAGQLEFQIDGGAWRTAELFHEFSAGLHYPRTVMLQSQLSDGKHTLTVRTSNRHHADSKGTAARLLSFVVNAAEWFDFEPPADAFRSDSATDLRFLNEAIAGEGGYIVARDGRFFHSRTNTPVRFWGVNGPPDDLGEEQLQSCARMLAKYGVNLVRIHGAVFDDAGEADIDKVHQIHNIVRAMKAEGIYTHLSIYFPLWFRPARDLEWLQGYDGQRHPFAALFFNPQFQGKHREWIRVLLTTPDKATGKPLLQDPAVFGLELQNEDSLFFWTFSEANLPEPQLRIVEQQFADWLVSQFGSLPAALKRWNDAGLPRDQPESGRMAIRPLWNLFNERTPRDQDTAAFLLELQSEFYAKSTAYVRQLGFRGLVHASNWATASPERLTPLEKLSYLSGDFIDRHGYFECQHKGENSAWSIRDGHTFHHRSALRFDGLQPGQPKLFAHPVIDPQYNDKPSMISETTFTRPNRYRSEAPLYYATYGSLQDSDAVIHFAFDGMEWDVKPRFWMQPWTLATPAMLAQFPAAALLYRRELVARGDILASVSLNTAEVRALQGTPLPQDAAFDELRLKDIPEGEVFQPGQRIDPLIHFAGRTQVTFTTKATQVRLQDVSGLIDRPGQQVTSSTGQVNLNYGSGLLTISSPLAQGASGALSSESVIQLPDLHVSSSLELGHIVAVSLDERPLKTSHRILLQVMSEERTTGFQVKPADTHQLEITSIGSNPWQVRALSGSVKFLRDDAHNLQVVPLDLNGYPGSPSGHADRIQLQRDVLYYLIQPEN